MPPGVSSAATATGVWREILTKRIERRLQTQLVRSSLHIESQQTFDVLSAAIGQEFDREMNGVRMSFGGEFAQLPGNETSGSEADSESWHNPGGSTQESEAAGDGKTGASGVHRAAAAQARRDSAAAAENPLHTVGLSTRDSAPAPDVALSVVKGTSEQSLTRVFPPSASPTMPPLIADRVTQPPAFGLSAPVTRQATRSEDVDVNEDDLAELSSKIQLILREEARRFGIAIP
jgi:hypothetical protein